MLSDIVKNSCRGKNQGFICTREDYYAKSNSTVTDNEMMLHFK